MSEESAPGQPPPVVGAVPLAQLKSVVLKNIDACVLLRLSKQYDAIQKKPEGKIEEKKESAGKRGRKQNRESASSEQEPEIETDPRAPHRWSGEPVYDVSLADDQVRVVTEAVEIEESTAFHVPLTFINTFEAPGNAPALAFYGDDQTVLRYPAIEIFRVKAKPPVGAASSNGKRKEPETFEGWVRLEQFDVFPEAALAAFYKREASELLTAISKFPHRESVTNQLIVGVVAKVAVEGSGAARMIGRNYAFLGPPGTGKTQFASWTARLFFLLGVVDVGHTVMASAATLIPGFEGQATRATARALSLARGGMLFVDEAYSLGDDKMGQQALTQLVAATGGAPQHQPMIVIVAGYERAMDEQFFARNRGLKDRFTVVSFPSYSRDQLYDLLEREVAAVNEAIAEANGWPKNHCRYDWAYILTHDVKLLFPHNSRTDDDNDDDSDKDGDDSDSDRDGDGEGEDDDNGGDEIDNAVDITDDNGDAVDINDDSDDAVDINDDNDDGDDQFGNMRFIKQLVRQAHDRAARRVCAAQLFEIDTQKPILVEVADLQDSVNPTLLADTVCPKVDAVLQKALISAAKQEGRMSIVMSALAHMWRPDDRELSAESSTYRYGHLRVPKKPKNVIDMIALRQARYLRHFNGIAAIMVSKRDGDHVYIMANDAYELGFRVTKKHGSAAGWKKWLSAKLPVGAVTYPVLSILLKDKELEAFKATLPQPNSAKSVRLYAALALLQSIENEFGLSDEPDLYFDEDMVNAVPLILELHKRGVRKEFAESAAVQLSMLSQVGVRPQRYWREAGPGLMDLVQPAWYTGKLIVGESTAQGQCLFSSVAMLVFGRRDDYVAVWLRGLCQLELMAYWEQYLDWFGNETASDMQKTLVGNDGNDWPVAEVLWVLANLLQRRIVVVRKLNQRTSAAAGGDKPFVVLPVRHAVNGWVGEAPLVLLHDNDHYQPLHASWSDGPLRQLAFGAEASSVLRDALQPLVGEWCNEPLAIVPLD